MPRASNQAVSSRQSGPEQARQIHAPSFSQQDSLVFRNRCHLPLTCHHGGKQAAHCHFRCLQRCMQAVSISHNSVPCATLQAPDTQCFISVTSPSQFSICQSNKSYSQVNLAPCRLTNPTGFCCSPKEDAVRLFRPLHPNRQAPAEKDRSALWPYVQSCIQVFTVTYNSSLLYNKKGYGNRVFISTKERSRAKVNWALFITPEHFTQEGFG